MLEHLLAFTHAICSFFFSIIFCCFSPSFYLWQGMWKKRIEGKLRLNTVSSVTVFIPNVCLTLGEDNQEPAKLINYHYQFPISNDQDCSWTVLQDPLHCSCNLFIPFLLHFLFFFLLLYLWKYLWQGMWNENKTEGKLRLNIVTSVTVFIPLWHLEKTN